MWQQAKREHWNTEIKHSFCFTRTLETTKHAQDQKSRGKRQHHFKIATCVILFSLFFFQMIKGRKKIIHVVLLCMMFAQGSAATTTSSVQEYDILKCNYLFYYETCFTDELNRDEYDLSIDVLYFWGLFESPLASPVDKKKVYRTIQMYLDNPEKYNLTEVSNDETKEFCSECKEITDTVLYYFDASDTLIKYSYPFLTGMGTVGNFLSFCIMNRKSLRDSVIGVNYAILAIVDTLNLWFSLFPYYLQEIHFTYYTDLSNFTCATGEAVQNILLVFSGLLISKISIERCISIYFPLKSKPYLTKKNAIRAALVLLSGTIILNIPSFIVSRLGPHKDHFHCFVPDKYVHVNQSELQVIAIFVCYVPFALIITANVGIILKLTCLKDNLSQQTANVQATSITVSLLVVSFFFLVFTSPITVINFAEPMFFPGYHPEIRTSLITLFLVVTHAGLLLNFGINFFLYISTGPTFRRELISMFQDLGRCLFGPKCCVPEGITDSMSSRHNPTTETSLTSA